MAAVSRSNEEIKMSKHEVTIGTFSKRTVAGHALQVFVRQVGDYFIAAVYSASGEKLADTVGETRKIATDRALRMAGGRL